ncbi:MAG: hypothetical protein LBM99_01005 [Bacillales bacterium]|nr:hypothetical protein [Bacillales bacterium]
MNNEDKKRAIREIVINSFAHADYKNIVSSHEIAIFPSKIEIFNPGNLPIQVIPETFANSGKNLYLEIHILQMYYINAIKLNLLVLDLLGFFLF